MFLRKLPFAWLSLALGLAIWLFFQGIVVLVPYWIRALPPEVDDIYGYIVKAPQLEECFWQDCSSLDDLYQQVGVSSNREETRLAQARIHHRILNHYTPLHSLALAALHKAGLGWESAYKLLAVIIWLMICSGLVFWLTSLWGPGPAGIGLGLLGLMVFGSQGIHRMVPSTLAFGLALWVWSWIGHRPGRFGWPLLIGIVILVGVHPIGRLYAWLSLILWVALNGLDLTRRRWPYLMAGVLFLILVGLLPQVIDRPALFHRTGGLPITLMEWLRTFRENFNFAHWTAFRWVDGLGSLSLMTGLCFFGFWTADPRRQQNLGRTLVLMALFVAASLAYVMPPYGPLIFNRAFIVLAVLLTGAVGQGLWSILRQAGTTITGSPEKHNPDGNKDSWLAGRQGPTRFTISVVMIFLVGVYLFHIVNRGVGQISESVHYTRLRQSYDLDVAQPAKVKELLGPGDRVLYLDEISLPFYLTHGCFDVGLVYYPALASDEQKEHWLNRSKVRFVVLPNPTRRSPILENSLIPTGQVKWIKIQRGDHRPIADLSIFLINEGPEVFVEAVALDHSGRQIRGSEVKVEISPSFTGWIDLPISRDHGARSFKLAFPRTNSDCRLGGIRLTQSQLNWPWRAQASLTIKAVGEDEPKTLSFDPSSILPVQMRGRIANVLADGGATCLAELGPPPG